MQALMENSNKSSFKNLLRRLLSIKSSYSLNFIFLLSFIFLICLALDSQANNLLRLNTAQATNDITKSQNYKLNTNSNNIMHCVYLILKITLKHVMCLIILCGTRINPPVAFGRGGFVLFFTF